MNIRFMRLKGNFKTLLPVAVIFVVYAFSYEQQPVYLDPGQPVEKRVEDQEYAKVLERMRNVLEEFMESTGDRIPELRTPDEFDRKTGHPLPNRQWPRPGKFDGITNEKINQSISLSPG